MNKILIAIALTIALPAVAHAQAAPAPKADCCEKMKAEGKECCCKGMDKDQHGQRGMRDGADAHAGHDMSGSADSHQNHQ
jgi:hypothetical protein